MRRCKLVATFFLLSCVPEHSIPESHTDSGSIVQDVEADGSRLRPVTGWKCADGAQSTTGSFFDTQTGALCSLQLGPGGSWDTGPFYCAPTGQSANPSRDVSCSRIIAK